jgi:hypothetical protein
MEFRGSFGKAAAAALAALLCLTPVLQAAGAGEKSFDDVKGHWAESYVRPMAEKGYVNGLPDGLFHPDEAITAEQFVAIVVRTKYGEQKPVGAEWASGYMAKAEETGILDGSVYYGPKDGLDRENAAKIVHLALMRAYDEPPEDYDPAVEAIEDMTGCKACRDAVIDVFMKGVMIGKPSPPSLGTGYVPRVKFDGGALLTRAEACVIIMKMLDKSLRTPPAKTQ